MTEKEKQDYLKELEPLDNICLQGVSGKLTSMIDEASTEEFRDFLIESRALVRGVILKKMEKGDKGWGAVIQFED